MTGQSQYLVRAITGPIVLITIGVLFTIDKFTEFGFGRTWPALLIVIGLLKLVGGRRADRGYYAPPPPPGASTAGSQSAGTGVTP
jgi:hypothetical protein